MFVAGIYQTAKAQKKPTNTYVSKSYLKKKVSSYLVKSPSLNKYFSLTDNYVDIFEDKSGKLEIRLYYDEAKTFVDMVKNLPTDSILSLYQNKGTKHLGFKSSFLSQNHKIFYGILPLSGMKIAIDPGHLGGNFEQAELEHRYILLHDHTQPKGELFFCEGNLAMETAWVLASLLHKAGAEVFLTRNSIGVSSFGKNFADWKKTDLDNAIDKALKKKEITKWRANFLKNKATDAQIFHTFFKYLDMKNRADLINRFQPNLAIILHFNANEKNKRDAQGFLSATSENSNLVFVPGAFMNKELNKDTKRMQFLYKMLSQQIEKSINASACITASFQKRLGTLEPENSKRKYLKEKSMYTGIQGIYSRNLTLARYVNFPMVYGETLFQDNLAEARRLVKKDTIVGKRRIPKRVVDVAEAYYFGILDYAKLKCAW